MGMAQNMYGSTPQKDADMDGGFVVHVLYGDYKDTTKLYIYIYNKYINISKYWYYRDTTKQKPVLWCTMVHCYPVSEP